MVDNLVVYTIIHQPRRLRLPAYPVSPDASADELEAMLFDDALNQFYLRKVAKYCYHPAIDLFQDIVEKGFRMSLGLSISFADQAMRWDPPLIEKLKRLVAHPNVELVCVEPYHSFLFYIDIAAFQERMVWARNWLEGVFGKRPKVAETTEMFMSREIYYSLDHLGFSATLAEGREKILGWRSPSYLYRHGGRDLALLIRHKELSDDVGYRFSQRTWHGYPLTAQKYVDWIKHAPGDFVFIGWDFETFGEHHSNSTGIFEFLKWMAGELSWRRIETLTVSQAAERFRDASYDIELPIVPTTWAGLNGDPRFFLGNPAQFRVFLLMSHAYSVARLTGDPHLIDISLQLCQSDNLHLLQWLSSNDPSEAEVSSYFTPGYWWNLGASRIPIELQRVYDQFIGAAGRRLEKRQKGTRAAARAKRDIDIRVGAHKGDGIAARSPSDKPSDLQLLSDPSGLFKATLNLSPGTHEYKLIVDGDGAGGPSCSDGAAKECSLANCVLSLNVK
ncbi:MAG: glycoside hydrolase [Chloroflexi bacterium]|nr:glycoside hydrolase [Chloroflexota bacterium]